jgi:hypothetical protein
VANRDQCRWIILLSGGTVHKPPPLDAAKFPVFESRQAAQYLIDRGIHPAQTLTEICSYDTIGNAYFSRLLFTDPLQLSNNLVVTSEFHLPRTRAIFEWVFSLPPVPLDYQLSFKSTPNRGLSPEALGARKQREAHSLGNLEVKRKKISTLAEFHIWLYSEHAAYAPHLSPDPIPDDELKSY